jgi:hypothetical protein
MPVKQFAREPARDARAATRRRRETAWREATPSPEASVSSAYERERS